jgi:hypothetical protein
MSTVYDTGARVHRVHKTTAVQGWINGRDLITEGVSSGSNLGRQNQNEWLRLHRVARHGAGANSGEVWVLGPRCMAFDGD